MPDDKKNPLGPTGDQVRVNVQQLRQARGLTKKDLADAVAALGRTIPPLGISRIEAGTRRVDADDLVALAIALNVSPGALLLPQRSIYPGRVSITGKVSAAFDDAWAWSAGESALPAVAGSKATPEQQAEYERLSLPEGRRRVAQHPIGRALQDATEAAKRMILGASSVRFPDTYDGDIELFKATLARASAEALHLQLAHDQVVAEMREMQRQDTKEWEEHVREYPDHGHGAGGEGGDG